MDVAAGTTDVRLSRDLRLPKPLSRVLVTGLFAVVMAGWLGAGEAYALNEQRPMHSGGQKQLWDRNTNRVELIGQAYVRQPDESLTADYILLDMTGRTLDARGNCIYITSDTIVYGDEMHFNLDTRTGTIVNGRVSNQAFTLAGERINKLSESRYQTHWGEYSTCRDCPQSWSVQAEDVDMEIDGYAFMDNIATRIKDAPAFWMPYLVVPMKTRRQSGFLFPTFRVSNDEGVVFVQPYFWAINRSADMTFGAGVYSAKGPRLEWEGRYALSNGYGAANVWHLQDKKFTSQPSRFAFRVKQLQSLPAGIEERLNLLEFTDNRYLFPGNNEPALSSLSTEPYLGSELSLTKSTDDFSASISGRRWRNFLTTDPNTQIREVNFDPKTVQVLPQASFATNERFLFGTPIGGGISFGVSRFTRAGGPYDLDPSVDPALDPCSDADAQAGSCTKRPGNNTLFIGGTDPLREATRFSIVPSAFTTFRPFDRFSLVPSARFYSFFYKFPEVTAANTAAAGQPSNALEASRIPDLYRGYLQAQLDLSTQFEKIYKWDDPETPRTKHLIRPYLSYSYIPYHFESWSRSGSYENYHPFVKQTETAGYRFDDYDIVPLDVSRENEKYFLPLGNSLAYGFKTQVIRKNRWISEENEDVPYEDSSVEPTYYTTPFEATAGQSLNFRELQKSPQDQRLFSRLYADTIMRFGNFDNNTTYYYYPYALLYHNSVATTTSYYFQRAVIDRFLTFQRSISLGYVWDQVDCTVSGNCGTSNIQTTAIWSINDWLLPTFTASYSTISRQLTNVGLNTLIQSTSLCWRFGFNVTRIADKWNREFDLSLNITGNGFGGVTEVANTAMTH